MIHARPDYERIQDPLCVEEGGIPEDEPVFLLRAQDKNASAVVRFWAILQRRESESGDNRLLASLAENHAGLMEDWDFQKVADITKEQSKR